MVGLQSGNRFLFCSKGDGVAAQLGQAIGDLGMLTQEAPAVEDLAKRLAEIAPQVVFLDFTLSEDEPGKLFRSAELARLLARIAPGIQGRGGPAQPARRRRRLARRGQRFRRSSVAPQEVKDVVQRLLDTPVAGGGRADGQRRSVLLLGTRPGVGTSTLAVLAGLVQDRMKQAHALRAGLAAPSRPKPPRPAPCSRCPAAWRLGIGRWAIASSI